MCTCSQDHFSTECLLIREYKHLGAYNLQLISVLCKKPWLDETLLSYITDHDGTHYTLIQLMQLQSSALQTCRNNLYTQHSSSVSCRCSVCGTLVHYLQTTRTNVQWLMATGG